mmetsp:Transcript_49751/g.138258  ORF Transcript_49751/g.138258 Transcript_49751/m.138258 type:complete len:224 (+) Transcript_49751:306-977(+)
MWTPLMWSLRCCRRPSKNTTRRWCALALRSRCMRRTSWAGEATLTAQERSGNCNTPTILPFTRITASPSMPSNRLFRCCRSGPKTCLKLLERCCNRSPRAASCPSQSSEPSRPSWSAAPRSRTWPSWRRRRPTPMNSSPRASLTCSRGCWRSSRRNGARWRSRSSASARSRSGSCRASLHPSPQPSTRLPRRIRAKAGTSRPPSMPKPNMTSSPASVPRTCST